MKNLLVLVGFMLAVLLPVVVQGAIIFDTGTPDESSNRSVFANPTLPGAQFLAQEFNVTGNLFVETIEAYIGGSAGNSIQMDLATNIGAGALAPDILGTYSLATPGSGLSGAFVSATVDLSLGPGTYYLVFSPDVSGGFLPIDAPTTIGTRYIASDSSFPFTNVNTALPIASDFNTSTFQPGIRIHGTVPEPTTLAIWGVFGGLGLIAARRRRKVA